MQYPLGLNPANSTIGNRPQSRHSCGLRALFRADYLLLTLPVAGYVAIESIHKGNWTYLLLSPEWSVATIFITLQTYRIYTESIDTHVSRSVPSLPCFALVRACHQHLLGDRRGMPVVVDLGCEVVPFYRVINYLCVHSRCGHLLEGTEVPWQRGVDGLEVTLPKETKISANTSSTRAISKD
jgi:hypothetical protein